VQGGGVKIDHPRGRHDDKATAVALACVLVEQERLRRMGDDARDDEASRPDPDREERQLKLSALMQRAIEMGHDPSVIQERSEKAGDDPDMVQALAAELEDWCDANDPDLATQGGSMKARLRRARLYMEELDESSDGGGWYDPSQPG
jgi:hypothetical protein